MSYMQFFVSFLLMQVIWIRNVSEISRFLTVIEFNTKFEEKRVGRSPQEILTRSTYRNVLTSLQGTKWRQNGIVPRYGKFSIILILYLPQQFQLFYNHLWLNFKLFQSPNYSITIQLFLIKYRNVYLHPPPL